MPVKWCSNIGLDTQYRVKSDISRRTLVRVRKKSDRFFDPEKVLVGNRKKKCYTNGIETLKIFNN